MSSAAGDHHVTCQGDRKRDNELMTPSRRPKFLLRSLLVISLVAGPALSSGCGPGGAGAIHIDSPKGRTRTMGTAAGLAPKGTARPNRAATPRQSVPRSAIKNDLQQNR